jgi:hypothetical protein
MNRCAHRLYRMYNLVLICWTPRTSWLKSVLWERAAGHSWLWLSYPFTTWASQTLPGTFLTRSPRMVLRLKMGFRKSGAIGFCFRMYKTYCVHSILCTYCVPANCLRISCDFTVVGMQFSYVFIIFLEECSKEMKALGWRNIWAHG